MDSPRATYPVAPPPRAGHPPSPSLRWRRASGAAGRKPPACRVNLRNSDRPTYGIARLIGRESVVCRARLGSRQETRFSPSSPITFRWDSQHRCRYLHGGKRIHRCLCGKNGASSSRASSTTPSFSASRRASSSGRRSRDDPSTHKLRASSSATPRATRSLSATRAGSSRGVEARRTAAAEPICPAAFRQRSAAPLLLVNGKSARSS